MTSKKTNKIGELGKRRASIEFYEELLQAFRECPGNISNAARACGTTRSTAQRAWKHGWKEHPWATPISEVIAAEQEIARVRIQDEKDAEEARYKLINPEGTVAEVAAHRRELHLKAQEDRAKVKEHSIQARVEIGKMIDGLVRLVQQGEAVLLRRNPGVQALADRLNTEMLKMSKAKKFDLTAALAILRTHNSEVRSVTQAGRRAFELQKTHVGEPSKILGVQTNFDDADETTLKREIEKALEAMDDSYVASDSAEGQVRH